MQNQPITSENKLFRLINNSPFGLVDINYQGDIKGLNLVAQAMLKPLIDVYKINSNNLYDITQHLSTEIADLIQSFQPESGRVIAARIYSISHTEISGAITEKYFSVDVTRMFAECFIVALDDVTLKLQKEKAMQQAELDKAVAQSKYELVSEVLHDIGNAVVGFGSYLNRINRMLEQNSLQNLQNLAGFMQGQQSAMNTVIGEAKSAALVNLLNGITKTQKENQEELQVSVSEQLNIISHIQEILNIQRQYLTGKESNERKPVNMRSMISDCIAMVAASLEKKEIEISVVALQELPAIPGDRTKLMQVILNILKNSIEAIDPAASKKIITIKLQVADGLLTITIEDNGKGFEPAIGTDLFKRGFTTKSTGTGLGLYNCKTIIESHSGSIKIESLGLGRGAITTIELKA